MAPVATTKRDDVTSELVKPVVTQKVFNPFYPPPNCDDGDESYKYANLKVHTSFLICQILSSYPLFPLAFFPKLILGATGGS